MAKFFAIENPKGLWLNTDYHSRYLRGIWRSQEDKRLYKSLQGLRSALGWGEGVADLVTCIQVPPFDIDMTHQDRLEAWELRMARERELRSVNISRWVELHHSCGFNIHEYDI